MVEKKRKNSETDKPNGLFMSHSKNHDFSGLDEGSSSLTGFKTHLASRPRCDDRRDPLFGDRKNHLGHKTTDLDTLNSANELISAAELAHQEGALRTGLGCGPEQEPIHLTLRDTMMSADRKN